MSGVLQAPLPSYGPRRDGDEDESSRSDRDGEGSSNTGPIYDPAHTPARARALARGDVEYLDEIVIEPIDEPPQRTATRSLAWMRIRIPRLQH